jgi:hypothetical protein
VSPVCWRRREKLADGGFEVNLIHAEHGPWFGGAMPGSTNGCGIFAGGEAKEFFVRCDAEGIYLAATLDQLLSANGVRSIFLVSEAPNLFVDNIRSFAHTHGYEFRAGLPDVASGPSVNAVRKLLSPDAWGQR